MGRPDQLGLEMAKKRVVIVGGGYIGVELAKSLDGELDVTLVEPKEAFIHAPAMLRALVDENVRADSIIPYDRLLKNGTVVKARAVGVSEDAVTVDTGARLEADFIVLAPGASNGGIFKPEGSDVSQFRAAQADVQAKIEAADRIAIVGAGAVGTELAGEIAHAHPGKTVTLISADKTLFGGFPAKLGEGLSKKLAALGVDLILGQRVADLASTTEPYSGKITLENGREIEVDLIIPAIGSKPMTALFDGLPGVDKAKDGRVKVDAYLRPTTWPNVFAAGDAADAGDAMTIVAASRQQPWLATTIRALAKGKPLDSQKPYAPWKTAPILVPLGPRHGNSFLILGTFGDWVTKTAKGSGLFIAKYRKILGYG